MKRGEIWTLAGGGEFRTKPRPALIIQDDLFEHLISVTVCAFTTDIHDVPHVRILVQPDERNGLQSASSLMVDRVSSVRRSHLGRRIGALDASDMARMETALMVFLGLATPAGAAN